MSGAPPRPRDASAELAGAFHHGTISRFNAWFFTAFARYLNFVARHHKDRAFDGLSGPVILEIGAGTGANLARIPPDADYHVLEPSLAMQPRLRERCREAGLDVTVHTTGAEAIPLPDGSVDEVISSLVLCTVADLDTVLAEVRRVLRPGGRFRFVEHVASPRRGPRRLVQRLLRRPWGWLFEGCNPGRDTPTVLERAGFADLHLEHQRFRRSIFWPVNTAVWGTATR